MYATIKTPEGWTVVHLSKYEKVATVADEKTSEQVVSILNGTSKRGPGRPPGSATRKKKTVAAKPTKTTSVKRVGRPKGGAKTRAVKKSIEALEAGVVPEPEELINIMSSD